MKGVIFHKGKKSLEVKLPVTMLSNYDKQLVEGVIQKLKRIYPVIHGRQFDTYVISKVAGRNSYVSIMARHIVSVI